MTKRRKRKLKLEQNKTKRTFIILGIILCVIVMAISGYIALNRFLNYKQSADEYQDIIDKVIRYEDVLNPDIPFFVDFDALRSQNEDCVGWLYIPCLEISYPIMRADNNDYYLHRTFERTELFAGSIFMDCINAGDFTDFNTILYGHNMMNGSMFGRLWHIPYKGVANDYPYFWIFTPEKVYRYQIFSAYDTMCDSKTYNVSFIEYNEFRNWCYEMRSWSYIDFGEYPFTDDDYVVTLSTCSGTSLTKRTVVQGVRESEYDYYIQQEIIE